MSLTIDGQDVTVPEGTTILDACATLGIDDSRRCATSRRCTRSTSAASAWSKSRARACWCRAARARSKPGMVVHTDRRGSCTRASWCSSCSASSVDLSTAPGCGVAEEYGAKPNATARRSAERTGCATLAIPGHHDAPDAGYAATVAQPVKVDNDLYVRDYGKCILCYKCVEACGTDHQNTFAIAVAGRGFDARISTEFAVTLPDSACVYCGNCIAVCPTGALMAKPRVRPARGRNVGRAGADHNRHDLPVLRRRLHAARCTCRTARSSKRRRRSTTRSRWATSASKAGSGGAS